MQMTGWKIHREADKISITTSSLSTRRRIKKDRNVILLYSARKTNDAETPDNVRAVSEDLQRKSRKVRTIVKFKINS